MRKLANSCLDHTQLENQTVQKHEPLVKRIAQHVLSRLSSCVQLDDLIQSGMIGLLEASKNYDAEKGASFETYASIRIRGSMLDEVRKGDWVPRSVHRNARKVAQAVKEVENQKGCDARAEDVADNLKVTIREYHRLLQETNSHKMFQFCAEGINEENISDEGSSAFPTPFERLQKEDFKRSLSKGIKSLTDREQLILNLYYDEELNLRKVGEILGVSESRVSQIHSQAMLRLKSKLREWREGGIV